MTKRITSRSITNERALEIALSIKWSMSATTDLCMAIRQKFKCSDNVAMKVYSRLIDPDRPLIRQVHKEEWLKAPPSVMGPGEFNCLTTLTKWELVKPKEDA